MVYGVIGVGAIAAAIVTGLSQGDPAPSVLLSPRNAATAADLARRHADVRLCADNQAVLDGAEAVLLCVRPQDAASLRGLRFRSDHAVISAMAGVGAAELASLVAPATDIARAIPLPAVARRRGVTAIMPATDAARKLFVPLGGTVEPADARAFDALSAATGTMAAHFAALAAAARWVAARGVPEREAERYIASLHAGLAPALGGGASFEALARDHTTPGGINALYLDALRQAGALDAAAAGLDRVEERLRPTGRARPGS